MAMTFVKVYYDWLQIMEPLSDSERGRLITAVIEYASSGKIADLSGGERYTFYAIKSQIDRDKANYCELSEKRKQYGAIGGLAKASKSYQKLAKASKGYQNVANASKTYQEKEEEKEEYTPPVSPSRGKKKASFVPPTLEEVEDYRKQRGSSVSSKDFFDYFEAGNWVDSEGKPVLNWKQKFITWDKNARKRSGGDGQEGDPYADVI